MSLCLCVGMMAQDMEAMGKLKKFFSSIAAYDKNYTQEKVYLHLDNNAYFPGEKIWFKAYVFKASTLLPTDMSKVLYVELVTPDGGVMERKTLPIYNGRTYGNFNLEDNHIMGYYEVRAYTRAMTNWDASHYGYSRVIPIFDEPKDTINFSNPVISQLDDKLVPFMRRKMPEALVGKEAQKERKTIMTFYPEGGHIVKGVSNRVAFKLTDDAGIPQDKTISVKAADAPTEKLPSKSSKDRTIATDFFIIRFMLTLISSVIKQARPPRKRAVCRLVLSKLRLRNQLNIAFLQHIAGSLIIRNTENNRRQAGIGRIERISVFNADIGIGKQVDGVSQSTGLIRNLYADNLGN